MKTFILVTALALSYAPTTQAALFDQETKLTATNAAAGDLFGISVAISGNTALVGAFGDDDAGSGSGSAYLFENIVPEPTSLLLSVMACMGIIQRRNR